MKRNLPPLGRFLKKVLIVLSMLVLCIIQLYKHQDPDVISQVLSLEYVKSVDDWPHGIKYARWDTDNDSPIDWNWLKILDKLLIPGYFENYIVILNSTPAAKSYPICKCVQT